MAFLKQAKTEEEIKKLTLSSVKKAYNELASDYNKIIENDYIHCPKCNEFMSKTAFYSSNEYATGYFPVCKKCLLAMAEQRIKKSDKPNETKESVQRVLQFMNLPYIDSLYESICKNVADSVNEKNKKSSFAAYIVPLKSLPQYKNKTWKDSEFGITYTQFNETEEDIEIIKKSRKRFGEGFLNEDYMFLENEYQDWITRYECNTKAQETIFERLSFKKWEIKNATKNGQSTKDLDKTFQELLATANIQPRQNNMDTMADAQTLGTLIQKWENERPLPEIDSDLEDVDKIGQYIDVFFKGHILKMFGLKNNSSHVYENIISKFTVKKPEYSEDDTSNIIYNTVFGATKDDE